MSSHARSLSFTKRKFLSFPLPRQHKFSAQILKELFLSRSKKLYNHYNEIQNWMLKSPLESTSKEAISNRYHEHLRQAKVFLKEHNFLPKFPLNDKLSPRAPSLFLTVYLDHIRSAHNVGSILRTVEAFSLGEVRFSLDTPFIDHPQVQKTSMNTVQHIRCIKENAISNLPRPLILLEVCEGAIPLSAFLFPKKFTLGVGNEEFGCSQELIMQADTMITIPLRGRKNSLNVANAFAIAAHEIAMQKEIHDE